MRWTRGGFTLPADQVLGVVFVLPALGWLLIERRHFPK